MEIQLRAHQMTLIRLHAPGIRLHVAVRNFIERLPLDILPWNITEAYRPALGIPEHRTPGIIIPDGTVALDIMVAKVGCKGAYDFRIRPFIVQTGNPGSVICLEVCPVIIVIAHVIFMIRLYIVCRQAQILRNIRRRTQHKSVRADPVVMTIISIHIRCLQSLRPAAGYFGIRTENIEIMSVNLLDISDVEKIKQEVSK